MTEAIGQVLGTAAGVAISPVPVIALILMLFSKAAVRNSVAFTIGWLVGLGAIVAVVLSIGFEASAGGAADSGGWLKIIIGAVLLVLAVKNWRDRPAPGAPAELPGWMAAIDDLSAAKAVGLGLVLTVANPKNLGLTVAAAVSISGNGLSTGDEVVAGIVFVIIASATILVPVIMNLALRSRAEPALTSMKDWLTANNATVMAVLFAVLGAKVLGDGIAIVG